MFDKYIYPVIHFHIIVCKGGCCVGSPAYNREHTVTILLRFNKKTDKDIIERFNSVGNKVAYVKRLVREDMKRKRPDIDDMIDASEKTGV